LARKKVGLFCCTFVVYNFALIGKCYENKKAKKGEKIVISTTNISLNIFATDLSTNFCHMGHSLYNNYFPPTNKSYKKVMLGVLY
jgi:hypothetical protein